MAEKYDIKVNLNGGGFTGQSQALRLAIARALVKINAEDKSALRKAGFVTRDSRVVERKSPASPRHAVASSSANVNFRHRLLITVQRLASKSGRLPKDYRLIG